MQFSYGIFPYNFPYFQEFFFQGGGLFSRGIFSWGDFFMGDIFLGDFFMGGKFPGGFFRGGIFQGGFFQGGFFPGGIFPRTISYYEIKLFIYTYIILSKSNLAKKATFSIVLGICFLNKNLLFCCFVATEQEIWSYKHIYI